MLNHQSQEPSGRLGGSDSCLTSAQVMNSRFVSLSPALGSMLRAQSLKPASDSVRVSLCPCPANALSLSLSQE